MAATNNARTLVFVGTYTHGRRPVAQRSVGIYSYWLDPSSGGLTPARKTPKVANPSYLALDPGQRCLYAVTETQTTDGQPGGGVSAFAVDLDTGGLRFLNRQPSHGTDPCHVCVDRSGRYVMLANYSSGSVALYPIEGDGRLGAATSVVQHVGSSVDAERQAGPHAHSINVDPSNRYALAADLGVDKILVYRLDLERGRLVPNDPPSVATSPGAGPRHLDFHPSGRYAYVVNELASSMTAYAFDEAAGTLRELQTLSTLPDDFAGRNSCADVHVTPSGRFVYGSNRGHDSLAIFAIDPGTGRLTRVGWESTQGQTPRGFGIDPTGTLLLAANQDTSTIVAFRIDGETGRLTPTGSVSEAPTPVCVKYAMTAP
jgi:6-phosphogluconolactonase